MSGVVGVRGEKKSFVEVVLQRDFWDGEKVGLKESASAGKV